MLPESDGSESWPLISRGRRRDTPRCHEGWRRSRGIRSMTCGDPGRDQSSVGSGGGAATTLAGPSAKVDAMLTDVSVCPAGGDICTASALGMAIAGCHAATSTPIRSASQTDRWRGTICDITRTIAKTCIGIQGVEALKNAPSPVFTRIVTPLRRRGV
jgi:hypothetical protein